MALYWEHFLELKYHLLFIFCVWIQNFDTESFGNMSLGKRVGARMMTVFNVCICLFKKLGNKLADLSWLHHVWCLITEYLVLDLYLFFSLMLLSNCPLQNGVFHCLLASLMAFIFIKSFALMDCYKMHSCFLQSLPNDSHLLTVLCIRPKRRGEKPVEMSEKYPNTTSTYFCPWGSLEKLGSAPGILWVLSIHSLLNGSWLAKWSEGRE